MMPIESNGFRRNASAAFRNDVLEIFSSSSRVHEDDDEALKWAALEKLPTFDRLRKCLLLGSRGAVNEVDIQDLGFQERKQLVERLVKVVEEDNEKFLLKFKNRIDRMTLLLGPPSSGKTTFLLALGGKRDPALKASGTVTYNGHSMEEFVPERTAAYISQHDVHIGEMTILGLEICADTIVGDQMIRGISGGQRKRVTTGEMLVGPAKALFMDEISTGLDSSTTFQVVNSIRQFVHILNGTAIIALLQPEPETFDLFDDIILISEGRIVYQGPRENVLEFFQSMGFKCPERNGFADFLQEVGIRMIQNL
ncbi:UNVERIFIED_CONTAM: Pleiotropic drug resistance protein 1 [Sesamum radiatum]|uniref:Pleiotropic drug resistance protein 1 n=1 Tax=Sesamum radiatum TaxID=300843 RepID=A0AAW2PGM6_SESRA